MAPPLLATKLYAPQTRPGLVPRPRLIARLAECLTKPLTLLSAPPGFGKTTLIADFRTQLADRPPAPILPSKIDNAQFCWLTLDDGDNDSTRFLAYLIAALQTVHPRFGESSQSLLRSPQPLSGDVVLPSLLNELADAPGQTVLVLDDYHLIHSQDVHQSLSFLIDHLPPRLHLIIATRGDLPLPLPRLRARGQLLELRQADLRFTALDRLTASVCDAVTGQNDGQSTLEWLERANLFIIPLDDERKWYRYHRLFADLLQKQLGEAHPELAPTLHRRASQWHEQNGLMAEAIDHALAAQDFERAAQLIEQIAEAMLARSESTTLLKWITALPAERARARRLLCVYYAWVLLLNGSPLEAVEARLSPIEESGPASSESLTVLAFVAHYRGDPVGAIALSRRALEQLPESESFFSGLARMTLAVAYHTIGDTESSQRFMREAGRAGASQGNIMITVNALCYRADLLRREGKLRQAQSLFQQALDLASGPGGARLPIASRALIGLGEIAREWNDLEEAVRCVLEGRELSRHWAAAGGLGAYYMLTRIRQAQKDWNGVRESLQAMRRLAVEFKASDLDDRMVDMVEAWMQIEQGDLGGARDWAERYGLSRDVDPAQFELGGDANTRRMHKYEYPVAARLWLAEGRPAEALALLESALPIAEKMNRAALVIEYEILAALAARALDQNDRAIQSLARALTLAQPEGYVRLFADEGEGLQLLLERMMSEGRFASLKGYIHKLLAAFGSPSFTPQPLLEPLSERELEVLRLIAEGLSNEDIAHRLVLSLPTIKWHTSNIYGKLGVKNRTEAVAKARALGILSTA
ncbi:MAG: tetratricopeptide repeat protein [Chloroflexi bacterium]|nr:tetratricopeptide repeat protein [Chloroflexota bacterium]